MRATVAGARSYMRGCASMYMAGSYLITLRRYCLQFNVGKSESTITAFTRWWERLWNWCCYLHPGRQSWELRLRLRLRLLLVAHQLHFNVRFIRSKKRLYDIGLHEGCVGSIGLADFKMWTSNLSFQFGFQVLDKSAHFFNLVSKSAISPFNLVSKCLKIP